MSALTGAQWLRRFRAMLRSPSLRARMPDTSSFSVRATLRDATPKGALAARGKPPAQAKPGVGGDAGWQLCVGTNRTSPSCDKPCGGCPQSSGMDCSGATKISSICRRWSNRKCVGLICPLLSGRRLLPPSDVQHGEDFLSFAFFADPAQLAQVFERLVQGELVRCDFGKPVLGVHWSHRLAPKNVLWLAPPL